MTPSHISLDVLPALGAALGASFHCVGMCGGLALASSAGSRGARRWGGQLLYHLGKTSSYLFLGALAGLGGRWLWWGWPAMGKGLAFAAGLLIAGLGLRTLGLLPRARRSAARAAAPRVLPPPGPAGPGPGPDGRPGLTRGPAWSSLGRALLAIDSPVRPLSLGMLSGWLPCPLVYAFLVRGAASGSVVEAVLTMAVLGAGTAPALLVLAGSGSLLRPRLRSRLVRFSGALLVLLGLWTAFRGLGALPCCGGLEQ